MWREPPHRIDSGELQESCELRPCRDTSVNRQPGERGFKRVLDCHQRSTFVPVYLRNALPTSHRVKQERDAGQYVLTECSDAHLHSKQAVAATKHHREANESLWSLRFHLSLMRTHARRTVGASSARTAESLTLAEPTAPHDGGQNRN